jgi:hypothetical protein
MHLSHLQARSQEFAAGGANLTPWGAGIWVNDVKFFDDLFFGAAPSPAGGQTWTAGGGKAPLATGLLTSGNNEK